MAAIKIPKSWEIAERNATPEDVYINGFEFQVTGFRFFF